MDNSGKTGILMATVGESGSRIIEDFVSKFGELDDSNLDISDLTVTGSVRVNGRWIDFGIDSSQNNGKLNTSHFISEGMGTHAMSVREGIENYFLVAGDRMYTHGRSMLMVDQDVNEETVDGKAKE